MVIDLLEEMGHREVRGLSRCGAVNEAWVPLSKVSTQLTEELGPLFFWDRLVLANLAQPDQALLHLIYTLLSD